MENTGTIMTDNHTTRIWANDGMTMDRIAEKKDWMPDNDDRNKFFFRTEKASPVAEVRELSKDHPTVSFYCNHEIMDGWGHYRMAGEYRGGDLTEAIFTAGFELAEAARVWDHIPNYGPFSKKAVTIAKKIHGEGGIRFIELTFAGKTKPDQF